MSVRGRAAWVAAVVPVLALTAACASGEPAASSSTDSVEESSSPGVAEKLELTAGSTIVGLPESLGTYPADTSIGAARTPDDTLIYVVAFGSSTCPMVADPTAQVAGDGAVTLTFPEPGVAGRPCAADFVPATTVVALPDEVDPEADLTVTIGTMGEVVLPAGSEATVWATFPL